MSERRQLITTEDELSMRSQCRLLGLHRSGVYYKPQETPEEDLRLMKLIDVIWTAEPSWGSRRIAWALRRQQELVNRKRVQRLMREMGIEALYAKPRYDTSKGHPEHIRYPYLLRKLTVDRPGQVYCSDITYIPMKEGKAYLVVIMDWFSRAVLSYRVSNTMDTSFCEEAQEEALRKHGQPDIMNTDQGSQFTSAAWVDPLKAAGVAVSMTGVGKCWDNIMVERLWRTVKQEEVYLKAYENVAEAREELGKYIKRYNESRPHSSLDNRFPMEVFRARTKSKAGKPKK